MGLPVYQARWLEIQIEIRKFSLCDVENNQCKDMPFVYV